LRWRASSWGFPGTCRSTCGGFVITRGPLSELVPIENAAMPERTVIEWDKGRRGRPGILKVDCLALGNATAIHKWLRPDRAAPRPRADPGRRPRGGPGGYDMICKADTVGVFQIESRAQMTMLPRLRPRCFYDLGREVAIVRRGRSRAGWYTRTSAAEAARSR